MARGDGGSGSHVCRREPWQAPDRDHFRYRLTDRELRGLDYGINPLSVSADKIAMTAWRCAALLHDARPDLDFVRRSGEDRLVDVYPGRASRFGGSPSATDTRAARRSHISGSASSANSRAAPMGGFDGLGARGKPAYVATMPWTRPYLPLWRALPPLIEPCGLNPLRRLWRGLSAGFTSPTPAVSPTCQPERSRSVHDAFPGPDGTARRSSSQAVFSVADPDPWTLVVPSLPTEDRKREFFAEAVRAAADSEVGPRSARAVVVAEVRVAEGSYPRPIGGPRGRAKTILDALHNDRWTGPYHHNAPLPDDSWPHVAGLAIGVRPGLRDETGGSPVLGP